MRFSEFGNALALPFKGSPYFTDGITVPENATLLVEPGVTIKLKSNYAQFIVDGTLKALGLASKGIVFTSDDLNLWCGLSFSPKSKNSDLEYVTVNQASSSSCGDVHATEYAVLIDHSTILFKNSSITKGDSIRPLYLKGSDSFVDNIKISEATFDQNSSAVFIDGGSPTIQNSTFSGNSIGIYSTANTALPGTPIIKNNTFSANTYPIYFDNPSFSLSGNTAIQNTYNGVFAAGAVYYSDAVWQADLPYFINQFTVNAGKKLTLQPGVVIKFIGKPYSEPGVRALIVNGTLLAQGTPEKPVTFANDDSVSNWRRIYFAPGSTGSVLQNTIIKYGGNKLNEGALYVESSSVQIQNAAITLQSGAYGFDIAIAACPVISGVTVQGGEMFSPAGASCPL